jgi:hypothetical protein
VAVDHDQGDGTPPAGATPDNAQGREAGDAERDARNDEPTTRRLRRRPNFRGHIVVHDEEPLPVFDAPADPPPAPSPALDGQAPQD